jgi:hypothetical protein
VRLEEARSTDASTFINVIDWLHMVTEVNTLPAERSFVKNTKIEGDMEGGLALPSGSPHPVSIFQIAKVWTELLLTCQLSPQP